MDADKRAYHAEWKRNYYKKNREHVLKVQHDSYMRNSTKQKERARRWVLNNPAKVKDSMLQRVHGINLQTYNELFKLQNGRCSICDKHQTELNRSLAVDHSHMTGKVRGLLCSKCNTGIGQFNESILVMTKAQEYLKKHDNKN